MNVGEPSHQNAIPGDWPNTGVCKGSLSKLRRDPDINRDQCDIVADSPIAIGAVAGSLIDLDTTTVRKGWFVELDGGTL